MALAATMAPVILVPAFIPAAVAEPNAVSTAAARAAAQLSYDGYVAGLNAVKVRAAVELRADGYDIGVNFRTAGMVGALLSGDMLTRVDGRWALNRAAPRTYRSAGIWRGDPRQIEIEYPDGQPHVARLEPPVDEAREPIAPGMTQDTTDALSAIAFLLHTVATTGACEGHVKTFDGRRVSEVVARTVGQETLPRESRSTFQGQALRCDLEGRQIAGFPADAGPNDMLRRVQHSTVWLASPAPGTPMVPVQMSFEVRFLGHMTLYVTQAAPNAQLAQFSPRM